MKALAITTASLMAAALLAGCGTTTSNRMASGAGIGLLGGPPGVLIGALAGGAAGAATDSDEVNLGPPVWDQNG